MNAECGLPLVTNREELLKTAFLVGGTKAQCTLGITFDLKHLNQRLERLSQAPIRAGVGNTVDGFTRKGESPAFIGVVRDGQKLAALTAGRFQLFPEVNLGVCVVGGDGIVRCDTGAEDDITVMLAAIDHGRGVLIAGKRSKHPRFVVSLGGGLDRVPSIEVILPLHAFVIAEVAKVFDQWAVFNITS